MEELENKNFEEEFLNVLDEPESTLILGASDETKGCTSYCAEYDPTCRAFKCNKNVCECDGVCYSDSCSFDQCAGFGCACDGTCDTDACGCNTPRGGTCYEDVCTEFSQTDKYYWWAAGRIKKFGYYLQTYEDYYMLNSARSWFTGIVSSNTHSNCAICRTLISATTNINNIKNTGTTVFYMSGLSNTVIGSTTSNAIIGYAGVDSSATTHMTGNTNVAIYARSTSSQTYFNSMWSVITATTGTSPQQTFCYVPEKTFTIDVVSGTQPIQGARIDIASATTIFPQILSGTAANISLRTGTEGRVCLCTSSTTATTIIGRVGRKGFSGNTSHPFTATQGTVDIVNLGTHQDRNDYETVTTINVFEINPEGVNYHYESNLNLTISALNTNYISAYTFNGQDGINYINTVLRFATTKKILPGLAYYINDPLFGKPTYSTYSVGNITLTTAETTFASFTWNTTTTIDIATPMVQNSNATQSATVYYVCMFDSYYCFLGQSVLAPSATDSKQFTVTYSSITGGGLPVLGTNKTLIFKAFLATTVSNVNLIGGTYIYEVSGGGDLS